MNTTEVNMFVTFVVGLFGPIAARWGVDASTTNALVQALAQAAPAVGAFLWMVYSAWNKRLVHETAVVTATAPTVADAKAASISAGK